MLKTIIIATFICTLTCSAFAGVRKIETSQCTNYVVDHDMQPDSNDSDIVTKRQTYGLYIDDMIVNFDDRSVSFDLKIAIVLGFNRQLFNKKIKIREEHPKFKTFVNYLNKDLHLFQEICLNDNNEVISYLSNGGASGSKTSDRK